MPWRLVVRTDRYSCPPPLCRPQRSSGCLTEFCRGPKGIRLGLDWRRDRWRQYL